jgi:hypothetical protein
MLYMKTPEMRVINETVASLAGKEIRDAFLARFYPEAVPPPPPPETPHESPSPAEGPPSFDFRAEMHETRLHVDALLAAGRIEEAERYMEQRRNIFWAHGYTIRKLNQAYLAFYGAYADVPGGAAGDMEDPVGGGFQVSALKAWLIENGELKKLLRAVSISGKALDILKRIDAVGKDFVLEPGTCGKGYAGDMVPVTTGGPTVRVSEMIVGAGGR